VAEAMRVLVIGASSQIGHFLLPRLRDRGVEVLALSRRPPVRDAGVRWLRGHLPDGMPELPALDAIISFGPLAEGAAWLAGASLPGRPRVIATSSMSAESKRTSPLPAERALAERLRAGEAALAAACTARGSTWTVLRPTLVYGAGLDKSLTPLAQRALRWRVFPLPAGRGLRQPVHAGDIAAAVLAALERPAAANRLFALGGGERLAAREMFRRVLACLPFATLPLPLPVVARRVLQRCVPALRGPLGRLDVDLIADNAEVVRALGIDPRPFRPDAAMFGLE